MKRSYITRHIIAGMLIAVISFAWCVWTEGKIPRVVKHTGAGESLGERWDWALNEGKAAQNYKGFWVGYSVTKWMSVNEYYGDNCIYHRDSGVTIEKLVDGGMVIRTEETDEDELRKVTLMALQSLGDEEAAEELDEGDYDEKGYAEKELAILALYENEGGKLRIEDVKIRRIDQRFEPQGDVLYWLGHAEDGESVDLLWNVFSNVDATNLRKRLVMAIGIHDAPRHVVPVLEKIAVDNYRLKVRENAIFWLGQQEGEESVSVLEGILEDERDSELRDKAIFALYCHGSDRAITLLSGAARNDRSTKVKKEAVFWLGQMAAKKTLDVLSDIAVDAEETEVQEHAVFAISQHSDDEAVPTLIRIARTHYNPEVRKKAIFWLGQTEDDRALDFFVELLREDE